MIGIISLRRAKGRKYNGDEVWFFVGDQVPSTKRWLFLNLTQGTLTRGRRKGETRSLSDVVDIRIEGAAPTTLVIEFADTQWRAVIRLQYENSASELIEKVVTWKGTRT